MGELAGVAALAGGAAVGLGEVQPCLGDVARGRDREVVAVAAAGDEEAEVLGGAGDLLVGVGGSAFP